MTQRKDSMKNNKKFRWIEERRSQKWKYSIEIPQIDFKMSTITSEAFTFESRTHLFLLLLSGALKFTVIGFGLSVYRVLKHLLRLIGQISFSLALFGVSVVVI
jgi:hypothetical protein